MAADSGDVARLARRAAAAATVATTSKAGAAGMGKTEALSAWLSALGFAAFAEKTMPPDQALFAWSVAGTVAGAVLGGLHLRDAGWLQRVVRMATCFFSGLLLAPYAIAQLPKAGTTPDWWHAFAASGISAAVGWILVDEAGPWVRQWVKARRGKA